jgi:hypothetical protein
MREGGMVNAIALQNIAFCTIEKIYSSQFLPARQNQVMSRLDDHGSFCHDLPDYSSVLRSPPCSHLHTRIHLIALK